MPSPALDAPKRLPLVQTIEARSNVAFTSQGQPTDAMLVNCFGERYQDETGEGWQVEKRPGEGSPVLSLGTANGYGAANLLDSIISVAGLSGGTNAYLGGTLLGPLLNSPGPYFFCLVPKVRLASSQTNTFVVNNNLFAYTSTGGSPTQITDASFPTTIAGPLQYLDGTTYVMDLAANIYNSANLNDPTVWTPQSLISASGNGDYGVYLAKQLNYIVALKSQSFLVYYDAGNATGSPLGIVQGASQSIGCAGVGSVQELDDDIYWVATNSTGARWVTRLRGLVSEKISTPAIDRLLNAYTADNSTFYSWTLRMYGHRFYGITWPIANLTMVLDIDQNIWSLWTDSNGNYWPIAAIAQVSGQRPWAQHLTNGNYYPLDIDFIYPTDNGSGIPVHIITTNFDGDIDRVKQLNVLRLTADQRPGNTVALRWSDDDYQTWSPYQNIDLSVDRPIATELGGFYRRAFDFYHNLAMPFRVKAVDLQLDIGTS